MYEGGVDVAEGTADELPAGRVNATTRAAMPSTTAIAAKAIADHARGRGGACVGKAGAQCVELGGGPVVGPSPGAGGKSPAMRPPNVSTSAPNAIAGHIREPDCGAGWPGAHCPTGGPACPQPDVKVGPPSRSFLRGLCGRTGTRSQRLHFGGVVLVHVGEPVGRMVRLGTDTRERLTVALQGFHVLPVRGRHHAVKGVGRSEVTEHSRCHGSARQLIRPVLGVPSCAVGLIAAGMQKLRIDEHWHSFRTHAMGFVHG